VSALTAGALLALTTAAAVNELLVTIRPLWSPRRRTATAAAPLPAFVLIPSAWLLLDALTSSPEQCGVDACGMAMLAALFGLVAAMASYLVGLIGAAFIERWRR